jgi:hypothetical protein
MEEFLCFGGRDSRTNCTELQQRTLLSARLGFHLKRVRSLGRESEEKKESLSARLDFHPNRV